MNSVRRIKSHPGGIAATAARSAFSTRYWSAISARTSRPMSTQLLPRIGHRQSRGRRTSCGSAASIRRREPRRIHRDCSPRMQRNRNRSSSGTSSSSASARTRRLKANWDNSRLSSAIWWQFHKSRALAVPSAHSGAKEPRLRSGSDKHLMMPSEHCRSVTAGTETTASHLSWANRHLRRCAGA